MMRPASQCLFRQARHSLRPRAQIRSIGTAPPHLRPRSWKSSAARWGIAIAGIYFYNTSPLFAQEPPVDDYPAQHPSETSSLPTFASLSPSSRFQPPSPSDPPTIPPRFTSSSPPSIDPKTPPTAQSDAPGADSPQGLEDEASQQGAFNEETGEINWECPCLGGMAHGPCGEQFRAAFSCFVFSKEEPKGMDCIDKFKGMQDCFRLHPDVYGDELNDDEEEGGSGTPPEGNQGQIAAESRGGQPGPAVTEAQSFQDQVADESRQDTSAPKSGYQDQIKAESDQGQPGPAVTEAQSFQDQVADDSEQ